MVQLLIFLISMVGPPDVDHILLSKLINSECGICTEKEMEMVGSVVLNRVESSQYPDSIEEVIFQPNQFCGARSPNFTRSVMSDRISKRLLSGKGRTLRILYFANPNLSKNQKFLNFIRSSNTFIKMKYHIFG